ncbi:MAG: SRPBCC family protein [Euryarchaeota archaeon]|nr:SRPBCC family protein [Euryarchaeota archaeon]
MIHLEHSAIVRAPREKTFSVLTDYENYPRTFSAFKSVGNIRREDNRVSFALDGLAVIDRLTPPQQIEREVKFKNGHIRAMFRLNAIPDGTEFRFSADITLKGFLGLVAPLVKRRFAKISAQNIVEMKRAAEAGT